MENVYLLPERSGVRAVLHHAIHRVLRFLLTLLGRAVLLAVGVSHFLPEARSGRARALYFRDGSRKDAVFSRILSLQLSQYHVERQRHVTRTLFCSDYCVVHNSLRCYHLRIYNAENKIKT